MITKQENNNENEEVIIKGYTVRNVNEGSNTVGFHINSKSEREKLKKIGIGNIYNGEYYVWLNNRGYAFIPDKKYEVTAVLDKINYGKKYYKVADIKNMVLDLNMSTEEAFDKLNDIRIRSASKKGRSNAVTYNKIADTIKYLIKDNCPDMITRVLNGGKKELLKELEETDKEIKKAKSEKRKINKKIKENKNLKKADLEKLDKRLEGLKELTDKKNITNLIKNYDKICSAIFNCFLPATLKEELKEYDLTIEECIKLMQKYNDLNTIKKELKKNPYSFICEGLKKSFFSVDNKILNAYPSFVNSEQRYMSALETSIKALKQFTSNTIFKTEDVLEYIDKEIKKHDIKYFDFCTLDTMLNDIKNRKSVYKFYDKEQELLTLEKYFGEERRIRRYFMNGNVEEWDIDLSDFYNLKDGKATKEQLSVLESVAKNKITFVDAGGGTGKTATLKAVIDMCKMYGFNYLLLAPTGRVAKRMGELTNCETMTIDRLWYTMKATGEKYVSDGTLVVVEEGSMLSIELFNKVLDIVGDAENVRFLINLDLKQLPPIGAGCPVRDMIYNIDKIKGAEVKELTKVFRYNDGGIAQKCADARKGYSLYIDMVDNPMSRYSKCGADFALIDANNYRIAEQVKEEYKVALKILKSKGFTRKQAIEKITVIAPMKKGEHGTLILNNILQEIANPKKSTSKELELITDAETKTKTIYRTNDRVMNTENNYKVLTKFGYEQYKLGEITKEEIFEKRYNPKEPDEEQYAVPCFNGSFGTIVDVDVDEKVVFVRFDDVILVFEKMQILKLSLAYAVTCHKLQGSENDYIISVFTDYASHMCNQNMIYTTISRSKKFFVGIWNEFLIENKIDKEEIKKRDTILDLLLKSDFDIAKIVTGQYFN